MQAKVWLDQVLQFAFLLQFKCAIDFNQCILCYLYDCLFFTWNKASKDVGNTVEAGSR
ncbi:MAG: hypothetical protein H6677_22675 [Candidatus Obscuribacterales bacterium]|nr:hypothetical protein [Candidatus Obscuribacterales bacterium]